MSDNLIEDLKAGLAEIEGCGTTHAEYAIEQAIAALEAKEAEKPVPEVRVLPNGFVVPPADDPLLIALKRFAETLDDGQEYDVAAETMEALAEKGWVRRHGITKIYSLTDYGLQLVTASNRMDRPESETYRKCWTHRTVHCAECFKEPAKPVPESVDDWVVSESATADEYDNNTWLIKASAVRQFVSTLTAKHEAELKAKDAEIAEWKMGARAEAQAHDECRAELAQAEAKGRREALQSIRPRAWTAEMDKAWHTNIPDTYAAFDALIESARAAQAEGGE